jgi:acyl-CoA reductase-like NAD-dependent aldehyde dehydrogenase
VLKIDKFYDFLGEARQAGCEVLCGGDRIGVDGERALDGAFVAPTVVLVRGLEEARGLRCVREETFFPLLPLVILDSEDEETLLEQALEWMDQNPYGLRNSLWATDPAVIETFTSGLSNGGLLKVNDSHIGFVKYLATHGGTGRTGGPFGELHYPLLRTSRLQGITISMPASAAGTQASAAGTQASAAGTSAADADTSAAAVGAPATTAPAEESQPFAETTG